MRLIAKDRVFSIIKILVGFLKDVKIKQEILATVYFKKTVSLQILGEMYITQAVKNLFGFNS